MTLVDFIRAVLLGELRRMVYEARLHYLAFGTIAVGIEFLGACDDDEPFNKSGLSTPRFGLGIDRMAKVDARYADYNKKDSPYNLYKHLRCGTAHIMRPAGPIAYSERAHDDGGPVQHLEVVNGKLLLVSEDFYDHFAQCCETLISELPAARAPKLRDPYLWVGDLK